MEYIRALFNNFETASKLRSRDRLLQESLKIVDAACRSYSDFGNSENHQHHHQTLGLFQDCRDMAFAISTDGAQLTMKKHSNTWLVILILLGLPADLRYKSSQVFVCMSIPGPNSPWDVESFLYPLFQLMVQASEGIWMWDAIESSYFVHRAYIVLVLGDMLGSAKLSGMAGHSAIYGDRFSMVRGAKAGPNGSKAKAQYYPIFNHDVITTYNCDRPQYDINNLPIRTEQEYWDTITQLANAKSGREREHIVKRTGVLRLSLAASSKALIPYKSYPIDPFHLFYENCAPHFWDMWTSDKNVTEKVFFKQANQLGKLVEAASKSLPPALCGPIRNIYTKRQSQYKIYEWMALVHWYIVPIGLELGMDWFVMSNFALFSRIVEFAMTPIPRTPHELTELQNLVNKFLEDFEKIYLNNDPNNISRLRLCIFQLVHVPSHIKWHGSIRIGSQATIERSIGELGGQIRSKKLPFEDLANIIFYREIIKILHVKHSELLILKPKPQNITPTKVQGHWISFDSDHLEIAAIKETIAPFTAMLLTPQILEKKWGKLRLKNGRTLHSKLSESRQTTVQRSSRWFEAMPKKGSTQPVFGEAIAFYETNVPSMELLVVYTPFGTLRQYLTGFWVGAWKNSLRVMAVSQILDIIGIWSPAPDLDPNSHNIYPLRKHPGLSLLTAEESGKEVEGDEGDENYEDSEEEDEYDIERSYQDL